MNTLKGKADKAQNALTRRQDKPARGGSSEAKRGGDRGARGGRGGGRGRGAANGAVDSRPGLGWSRDEKIAYTCTVFNKGKVWAVRISVLVHKFAGDACDGSCNLAHKCSKEESHGRFCWKDHARKDHK